ncbi:hypothetical protein GOODEAATRI_016134 [Goodea atripinnis]|uniref:C-type lectin domain-containing protein n=1 Tax=Goodea atripinnis TaxID=208336 RepID=A0ABV0PEH3_9TELE
MATGSATGLWEVKECASAKAKFICRQNQDTSLSPEPPAPQPTPSLSGACPNGWKSNSNLRYCYKVFYSSYLDQKQKWLDAHLFCRKYGANLLSISSPDEEQFVLQVLHETFGWVWTVRVLKTLNVEIGSKGAYVTQLLQLFCFVTAASTIIGTFGPTSPEWIAFQEAEYKFFDHRTTWEQAQRICSWFDSSLTSIHSAEEQAFLANTLSKGGTAGGSGFTPMKMTGVFAGPITLCSITFHGGSAGHKRSAAIAITPTGHQESQSTTVDHITTRRRYSQCSLLLLCLFLWFVAVLIVSLLPQGNCAVMIHGNPERKTGMWASRACEMENNGFICQKQPDRGLPPAPILIPASLSKPVELGGVTYRVVQKRLDWTGALYLCESLNGTLAVVKDPYQQAYLMLLINSLRQPAWISLYNYGVLKHPPQHVSHFFIHPFFDFFSACSILTVLSFFPVDVDHLPTVIVVIVTALVLVLLIATVIYLYRRRTAGSHGSFEGARYSRTNSDHGEQAEKNILVSDMELNEQPE